MKTGRVTLASEVADLAYFVPNMDSVAVSTITLYIVDHDRRFSYQGSSLGASSNGLFILSHVFNLKISI